MFCIIDCYLEKLLWFKKKKMLRIIGFILIINYIGYLGLLIAMQRSRRKIGVPLAQAS